MRNEDIQILADTIKSLTSIVAHKTMGREVVLLKGKYHGRCGIIRGVIPDVEHGFLYLVMAQREDGQGDLNTDGASRSYIPLYHFTC